MKLTSKDIEQATILAFEKPTTKLVEMTIDGYEKIAITKRVVMEVPIDCDPSTLEELEEDELAIIFTIEDDVFSSCEVVECGDATSKGQCDLFLPLQDFLLVVDPSLKKS